MPSLRLTIEDARDIASYLITQKHRRRHLRRRAISWTIPRSRTRARRWSRFYGCAGCHEICGLEDEGRIGTELTNEGSKPIERLDFALLTEDAKRGVLPDGKQTSPARRLVRPEGLLRAQARQSRPSSIPANTSPIRWTACACPSPTSRRTISTRLTTMLLGSTDPVAAAGVHVQARRRSRRHSKGLVDRHEIQLHRLPSDRNRPAIRPDGPAACIRARTRQNLPPVLTSEGARVNPEWLKGFLANPSLSTTDTNRNGVRSYLQVRMPTFYLLGRRDSHAGPVLRGHVAASRSPTSRRRSTPITTAETAMARDLFTSTAAPCLKCHATGDPAHDKNAIAPNFLFAKERLQARLDRALDHQSRKNRSRARPCPPACSSAKAITGSSPAQSQHASTVTPAIKPTCWCVTCST